MLLTCLLPADLRFKCMESPITCCCPAQAWCTTRWQQQYAPSNGKGFPGQTLESQKGTSQGHPFKGAAVQLLLEAMQPPRDCCSVETGVVLQLVYFQQKGGSVQHIIVLPHTFRMQAQEGQHVSAVKPPWPQLEMHCAGQINQAIPGGGHGCAVAVSVPNTKSADAMSVSENMVNA